MGLFSKRKSEPVIHPDVTRRIHARLGTADVVARMADYGRIAGSIETTPAQIGHVDGWTTVVLTGRLHPWAIHNLAHWIVDGSDAAAIVAVEPGPESDGYWLVPDRTFDDWWVGYSDNASPITVAAPGNDWVIGDPHSEPSGTAQDALARHAVPEAAWTSVGSVSHPAWLEDPGSGLNPTNAATRPSRSAMAVHTPT